ncbi:hypothetical protein M758_5G131500 [Ceratodon purpureus]|nr:hypothetical protein M758_5G131500 [Ceratodon purpureus]
MSLYSQMQSIAGRSSRADEPVQRELKSFLQQLNWSYVALWTFNHQTSKLEWRGGHFRVNSTAVTSHGDSEVWNEHLFNSTYKSCSFASGQGCVGMAYAETKNIWTNGLSVHHSAGSKEQAQFLQHAGIETVVCIPWAESVLELGTCKTVAENLDMTAYMCVFLLERILPSLAQAAPNFSQASLATSRTMMQSGPFPSVNPTRHLSDKFLDQDFELNSLNEQIRKSSSLSSLNTDMFLQPEEGEAWKEFSTGLETGNTVLTDPRWRTSTPPTSTGADIQLQTQTRASAPSPNQALMSARVQHSGTTSSSVSISEEGSVMLSPSPRRGTPTHSPELQIGDTSIATGIVAPTQNLHVEDEIQQVISHMLEEGEAGVDTEEQWRNLYMNPAQEAGNVVNEMNLRTLPNISANFLTQDELTTRQGFKLWRHARVQAPVYRRNNSTNQALQRRCIQMLKRIPSLQQGVRPDATAVQSNINQQGPRLTSSSASTEVLPDIGFADDPFDQTAPLRGQRRPRGARIATTGPVNANHDEAAMNHMMAERRRRVKQKENFSALRTLVPIISKADKASILGDAIVYIKDLQERIRELESSRAQTETRYEKLKKTNQDLEQRNKELEAMAAGRDIAGGSHMQQQQQRSPSKPYSRQSV